MTQENEKSADRIKQEIDFYKENLKFLNSFYLPLFTGLVIILFDKNDMPIFLKIGWFSIGGIAINYINLLKKDVSDTIDSLIKKL